VLDVGGVADDDPAAALTPLMINVNTVCDRHE
jgi:hypothetical protein